jgi:hypothetical protein
VREYGGVRASEVKVGSDQVGEEKDDDGDEVEVVLNLMRMTMRLIWF